MTDRYGYCRACSTPLTGALYCNACGVSLRDQLALVRASRQIRRPRRGRFEAAVASIRVALRRRRSRRARMGSLRAT